ncbi:MAG: glycosyltransferase family 4 protein [Candidatus Zixiibacteriota bacterium]
MRILFLGEAIAPHLMRWHTAFEKLGWEVKTASCDFNDSFTGVKLEPRRQRGPLRYLTLADQVEKLIADFKPNIINAHFLPTYGLTAASVNAHPLVITLWGSDLLLTGTKGFLRRKRSEYVLKRADLVVMDSQMMVAETKKIVPIPRHLVVSFGVRKSWYESGQARALTEAQPLRILSTRRHEPLYDVETALKAARILKDETFAFVLTIAGSGSLEMELRQRARELGVDDVTNFTGYQNDEQLFNLYRNHDVYVSTAKSDSSSVSLLEAMSQKLYPVVTDIAGNREWLADERHFFPILNAAILAAKIKAGQTLAARNEAYAAYEPTLAAKGIREQQMRLADYTFKRLIDDYAAEHAHHSR